MFQNLKQKITIIKLLDLVLVMVIESLLKSEKNLKIKNYLNFEK